MQDGTHNSRDDADALINARQLRALIPVSAMTIWRWRHQPESDFPRPTQINGRNYWPRAAIRAWWRSKQEGQAA